MDHATAVRTMAVERYLLDEFGPQEKDEFEQHFFSCDECAREIKAGAALMEHGKAILARNQAVPMQPAPVPVRRPGRPRFAWLRPAFAVPAMAFLLGIVAFQNLVQLPALQHSLTARNAPALLPSAYLASGSARGGDHPVITAGLGQPFLLLIDIPGQSGAAHTADLYDAAGQKKWSLAIPKDAGNENLPLQVPSGNDPPGIYTLIVHSDVAAGQTPTEVSRYAFELKRP